MEKLFHKNQDKIFVNSEPGPGHIQPGVTEVFYIFSAKDMPFRRHIIIKAVGKNIHFMV